jgi:hypothetical protein
MINSGALTKPHIEVNHPLPLIRRRIQGTYSDNHRLIRLTTSQE